MRRRCRWSTPTARRSSARPCAKRCSPARPRRWSSAARSPGSPRWSRPCRPTRAATRASAPSFAPTPSAPRPPPPARSTATAFEWIADADSRLGPVLEVVINGRYGWVPFSELTQVTIEAPADLRDMVWAPAQLSLLNGGQTVALVPARYPGTGSAADAALQLSRKTEWLEIGERSVSRPRPAPADDEHGRARPARGARRSSCKPLAAA